jgi:hypothetical protein
MPLYFVIGKFPKKKKKKKKTPNDRIFCALQAPDSPQPNPETLSRKKRKLMNHFNELQSRYFDARHQKIDTEEPVSDLKISFVGHL